MDYKSLLNERQYEAVSTSSQYVRIVAGAGSGKTRVLTYRIAYLISEMNVYPNEILAITFTNKAAGEMADRASKLVDEILGYTPRLNISTFHAFCSRFLRIEAGAIGFPTSFTIYDEDDRNKLLKNIGVEMGYKKGDSFIKEASQYIGRNKTKGLYPDDIFYTYLGLIKSVLLRSSNNLISANVDREGKQLFSSREGKSEDVAVDPVAKEFYLGKDFQL